jgi:hypothetical protein
MKMMALSGRIKVMDIKSPLKKTCLLLFEHVEKIPWYWIGLFTSLVLLILSTFMHEILRSNIKFYYGYEYGAVGAALAQGRGFSDPFAVGSGATAWVSPLLPAIIGSIFFITNFKFTETYWILHLTKIFSLGLGTGLIWSVLQKKGQSFATVFYLWMGILFYLNSTELLPLFHDEWLIFLVISLSFWAWHKRASLMGSIILVVAFSAAALCNPILWVALFIVILIFNYKTGEDESESVKGCLEKRETFFKRNSFRITISVSFLLVLGWTVRNWVQLGIFAPIKSNAGYEIFQAQVASRSGVLDYSIFTKHPITFSSKEHRAFAALGEANFIRSRSALAIRTILAHPTDFCRRVLNRFINAFLFTVTPVNIARVDPKLGIDDFERLSIAGFVGDRNGRKIWLDLDDPDRDKDLIKVLPSLGLTDPQLAIEDFKSVSSGYFQYRFSWDHLSRASLLGGLPWVALLIAILMRRHSALPPFIWWISLFMFFYLIPYALISHYLRYQLPLLGMQAILLTAGTIALLRTLKHEPGFA